MYRFISETIRQGYSYCWTTIRTYKQSVEWCHLQLPWLTLTRISRASHYSLNISETVQDRNMHTISQYFVAQFQQTLWNNRSLYAAANPPVARISCAQTADFFTNLFMPPGCPWTCIWASCEERSRKQAIIAGNLSLSEHRCIF